MKNRDYLLNVWKSETGKETVIRVPVQCAPSTQYYQARTREYTYAGED
jgi:hypothetical protein